VPPFRVRKPSPVMLL